MATVIGAVVLAIYLCFIPTIDSARYLLHAMEPGSNALNVKYIGEALAARGHDVTFLIPEELAESLFSNGDAEKSFKMIKVKGSLSMEIYHDIINNIATEALQGNTDNMFIELGAKLLSLLKYHNTALLNNLEVKEQLVNQTFDLALIIDYYIQVARLMNTINVPYVVMAEMMINPYHEWEMRASRNPAYYPGNLLAFDQNMNFGERLWSTVKQIEDFLFHYIFITIAGSSTGLYEMDKSTSQLFREAELWFIRSHFTLDYPRPFLPHVIPMGGQMARPAKSLKQVGLRKNKQTNKQTNKNNKQKETKQTSDQLCSLVSTCIWPMLEIAFDKVKGHMPVMVI